MAALATMHVACPAGDAVIDVPVTARMAEVLDDVVVVRLEPDTTELLAHLQEHR